MRRAATWAVNAAVRTLHAAFPALAATDDDWALGLLEPGERSLFEQLPPPERAHAVKVARCLLAKRPDAPGEAVRAALLHDVGKVGSSNGAWHRVLAHLLPELEVPPEPRLTGLAGARQARRHHAAYGALMVLRASGDARVAWLVRHHHGGSDEWALAIGECDAAT